MTYNETKRQLEAIAIGATGSVNGQAVTRWTETKWEAKTWGKKTQGIEQAANACGFRSVGSDWITNVIQDNWSQAFAAGEWATCQRCRKLYDRRQYQTGLWKKEVAA